MTECHFVHMLSICFFGVEICFDDNNHNKHLTQCKIVRRRRNWINSTGNIIIFLSQFPKSNIYSRIFCVGELAMVFLNFGVLWIPSPSFMPVDISGYRDPPIDQSRQPWNSVDTFLCEIGMKVISNRRPQCRGRAHFFVMMCHAQNDSLEHEMNGSISGRGETMLLVQIVQYMCLGNFDNSH